MKQYKNRYFLFEYTVTYGTPSHLITIKADDEIAAKIEFEQTVPQIYSDFVYYMTEIFAK